jgi:hypothetical protein
MRIMESIINNQNEYPRMDYYENLSQKTEEYIEFLDFIIKQESWDKEIEIIKGEDWTDFYSEEHEENYDMKIFGWVQASEFYDKIEKLFGLELKEFENNFISSKYLDTYTYNTINLIVNINGKNEGFVIDCV